MTRYQLVEVAIGYFGWWALAALTGPLVLPASILAGGWRWRKRPWRIAGLVAAYVFSGATLIALMVVACAGQGDCEFATGLTIAAAALGLPLPYVILYLVYFTNLSPMW
jgi:hypothetical protein